MTIRALLRTGLSERTLEAVLYGLGVLIVAAIVHLASVLAISRQSTRDAYAHLATLAGHMPLKTFAGPPIDDRALPFRDPALAMSFCLYNLQKGPVRVDLDVSGADFVAVSFHSRRGLTFYGLTNRSASNNKVALVLMTPRQLAQANARDTGDEEMSDLRISAPEPEGFVLVQALAATPSAMPAAEAIAQRLTCSPAP